jgi:hypothetical protein
MAAEESDWTKPHAIAIPKEGYFTYEEGIGGDTLPVKGENYVLMGMNTLAWVSKRTFWGAHYSAAATLPVARNSLTSDIAGNISGGLCGSFWRCLPCGRPLLFTSI